MSKKPKKYNIDSFEKFFNVVSEDNFDRFFVDFASHVGIYLQICKQVRRDNPKKKYKLNSDIISFTSFNWIDDGKTGVTGITVQNHSTGEVVEFKKK